MNNVERIKDSSASDDLVREENLTMKKQEDQCEKSTLYPMARG